jgi:hypothetical protein
MISEISLPRIQRLTLLVAAAGALVVLFLEGPRSSTGFLIGAALSLLTLRSWTRLSDGLGTAPTRSVRGAALFLILRYLLIAGAIYAIVNLLGITPVAMILGLLAAFAAVILELLYQSVISR